jgi:signal transduction histidine kinase
MLVLRAVRASTTGQMRSSAAVAEWVDAVARFERSIALLVDLQLDTNRFRESVVMLADLRLDTNRLWESAIMLEQLQPTLKGMASRLVEPTAPSGPIEVTESRIVAELNHALQTPLRGLGYAARNLENLPDGVLIQERAKRLADMTAMLDSCTSALATFRGLVDTVASVPARQPSLDKAVRVFGDSIPHPTGKPVVIDLVRLPDRVDGFSNHYLLTMLQPLVENAIEGCTPGGTVEITCTDHGDAVEFTVFNPVDHLVDDDVLFAPRRTTKDGHQGLGVSIVSRLAEFERGVLTADVTDTGVRMRVVLPRR